MESSPRRIYLPIVILAAAAAFSVIYQGFDYGISNNASHVAMIHRAKNPSLLPGNEFIDALKNYCSALWWIIPRLTFVDRWETPFLVMHIVTRFLILLPMYLMLAQLTERRWMALCGTTLLPLSNGLLNHSAVARSDMLITYFNQTEVSLACILMAYALVWRRRDRWACLAAAISFNFNAFFGAWGVLVIGAHLLYRSRRDSRRARLRALIPPLAIFTLGSLPTAIWILSILLGRRHDFVPYDYGDFLWKFYPFHYFIGASPSPALLTLIVTILVGVLAIRLLPRWRELCGLFFGGHVALFLLGALMPLITTGKLFMDIQFMRNESFIALFAALFVAAVMADRLAGAESGRAETSLAVAAFLALLMGLWVAAAAALLLIPVQYSGSTSRPRGRLSALLLGILALLVLLMGTTPIEANTYGHPRLVLLCWLAAMGLLMLYGGLRSIIPVAVMLLANQTGQTWLLALLVLGLIPWALPESPRLRLAQGIVLFGVIAACVGLAGYHFALSRAPGAAESFGVNEIAGGTPRRLTDLRGAVQLYLVGAGLALAAALSIQRRLPNGVRIKVEQLKACLVFALAAMIAIGPVALAISRDRIARGTLSNLGESGREYRQMQRWVADHTAIDANFLLLAHRHDFPVYAKRNFWWTPKYGDGVICEPRLYWDWRERRESNLRFEKRPLSRIEEELIPFAAGHGLTHVVLFNEQADETTRLRNIYRSETYSIFEFPAAGDLQARGSR